MDTGDMSADDIAEIERALTVLVRRGSHPRAQERLMARAGTSLDRGAYVVLGRIGDGEACRVSALAAQLGVDVSTVSRHVGRLESLALVRRTGDPEDRRAATLELTDAGTELLERLRRARREAITELLEGWSEVDRHQLATLLRRLTADLLAFTERAEAAEAVGDVGARGVAAEG